MPLNHLGGPSITLSFSLDDFIIWRRGTAPLLSMSEAGGGWRGFGEAAKAISGCGRDASHKLINPSEPSWRPLNTLSVSLDDSIERLRSLPMLLITLRDSPHYSRSTNHHPFKPPTESSKSLFIFYTSYSLRNPILLSPNSFANTLFIPLNIHISKVSNFLSDVPNH